MNESSDHDLAAQPLTVPRAATPAQRQLQAYLEDHAALLLGTIRLYVRRFGLAQGEDVSAVALDVLQEVALEALSHEARFTSGREPRAWLLGIAVNIIRRKKAEQARRAWRELPYQQVFPACNESATRREMQEASPTQATIGADITDDTVESQVDADALLALVSEEDQEVLKLAILEEFDSDELATRLSVTAGAARMRLHRALVRLRAAFHARLAAADREGDGRNA